jgi:hypothetical protein
MHSYITIAMQLCNYPYIRLSLFTRVGTYVQRGSKFCFVVVVVVLGVTVIAQNIALLSNFTMHSAALPPALPGSLARQPCPAALPGSLARQFDQFRPDLMRSLALQSPHCTTVAGHQTACARCCPDRFKLVQLFLCRPIAP